MEEDSEFQAGTLEMLLRETYEKPTAKLTAPERKEFTSGLFDAVGERLGRDPDDGDKR